MGRSYVTKGVPIGIPRYSFTPKGGDRFYIRGQLVKLARVSGDEVFFPGRGLPDGTLSMSVGNLYQIARVPEDSRFAPYEVRAGKPVASNPRLSNRLTPAKIRVGRKTVSGFARRNPRTGKTQVFVTPRVARRVNPDLHQYLVMLFNKDAPKNIPLTVHASTAGQASRIAKKRKAEVVNEPRKWRVLSVKRVN